MIGVKVIDEMVAAEGWRVDLCTEGYSALDKLTGNDRYDLLLIDNDIPQLGGLELIKHARAISHRRRTPVVMLSGKRLRERSLARRHRGSSQKARADPRAAIDHRPTA